MEIGSGSWPSTIAAGLFVILLALVIAAATRLMEMRDDRLTRQRRLAAIRSDITNGRYGHSDREIAEALLKQLHR
jgi:anti-sigma28 factor (negative regulator of flagellin synthesis)